jgi:arylsulfatase A-like enzyme
VIIEGHPRQALAGMMWAMDRPVGDVVEASKQEKKLENTLIFIFSDNGESHPMTPATNC